MRAVSRTYLPLRELNWHVMLAIFAVLFASNFFYKHLEQVATGGNHPLLASILEELSGIIAALLLFPFIYWVAIRFPLLSATWQRNLPIHLLTVCFVSFLSTNLMWVQRLVLFPTFGLGHYNYGYIPVRYLMEFAKHFVFYWFGVGLIYLFHEVRFAREREIQQAKLEASLAEAQAQNLRLQLEPHFLFNTLNAISAAVYEDPQKADKMICGLSEMLRRLLSKNPSLEIPLSTELELLDLYANVMKARLEHRFKLQLQVDDSAKQALVPQLLLQPLIENAIRHGINPHTFQIDISLSACLEQGRVHLIVRDSGPGFRVQQNSTTGVGLHNTRERLAGLYGEEGSFTLGNAPDGGAIVQISLPFRVEPAFQ
ncbi:MAG: histidine kinase [Acidobacteriaceae bacterium]|nr:histidine kinase [Acidobacteriaceae bacterium]MBV9308755.1 histidine kinase [Acidobacteriaceae bacterium]MBV9938525.1 histidine kinase [Acidobacteriaceae bacterium]